MSGETGLPLTVENVKAGYGKLVILHGVSVNVEPGELVTIIGPNGSGKSTLLKTIFGFTTIYEGRIVLGDRDITRVPPSRKPYFGMAYVPQVGNVFPNLTVEENLRLSKIVYSKVVGDTAGFEKELRGIYEWFPILYERRRQRAGTLSGGERQMLAIAKALLMKPRVMLLDEPTAALSPKAAEEVFSAIRRIADSGITVLLVEQNAKRALEIADRGYILVQGKVAYHGHAREILEHPELGKLYLGLVKA